MTEIKIEKGDVPDLEGKVALITVAGGASGIGLSTAKLLLEKGATVHIVDIKGAPSADDTEAEDYDEWPRFYIHQADVLSWPALRDVFEQVGRLDMCFANAGITDVDPELDGSYLEDDLDGDRSLAEPHEAYRVLDVNSRGVLNTVKLAHYFMRKHGVKEGSIVVTGSSAMYWPDGYVPLASVAWGGQLNLIRSLHRVFLSDGITLNGVAVFVALCRLVPYDIGLDLMGKGVPVSEAKDVALALAYSAVAREKRRVVALGDEKKEDLMQEGRWNGRVIQVVGTRYREIEQPLTDLRDQWFGEDFSSKLRLQQTVTLSEGA